VRDFRLRFKVSDWLSQNNASRLESFTFKSREILNFTKSKASHWGIFLSSLSLATTRFHAIDSRFEVSVLSSTITKHSCFPRTYQSVRIFISSASSLSYCIALFTSLNHSSAPHDDTKRFLERTSRAKTLLKGVKRVRTRANYSFPPSHHFFPLSASSRVLDLLPI
jgi:hypothetical protein